MAGLLNYKRLMYYSRNLSTDGTINVLMVSLSQTYLEQMGNDLYLAREIQERNRPYNFKVHTCKTIADVVECMPDEFFIDFIVFILDTSVGNCLQDVENNMSWVDSCYPNEKVCLVNPDSTNLKAIITPSEIWDFAKLYRYNLINGNIKKTSGLFSVSKRILNLVENTCGLLNGIPMISNV